MGTVVSNQEEKRDGQENEAASKLDQSRLPNTDCPSWLYPAATIMNLVCECFAYGGADDSTAKRSAYEVTEEVDYCSNWTAEPGECNGYCHY